MDAAAGGYSAATKQACVSAGVGIVDIIADEVDFKQGYTKSFQNVTDWARVGAVVGGYAANSMGYLGDEITESAVLAGIPLLEKSVINAVRQYTNFLPVRPRGRMGLKLKQPGSQGNIKWG